MEPCGEGEKKGGSEGETRIRLSERPALLFLYRGLDRYILHFDELLTYQLEVDAQPGTYVAE
jgi:hypothetical protein